MDVAAIKDVAEEQKALLDTASTSLVELRIRCDEASACTARCLRKLFQEQKHSAVDLEKVKDVAMRVAAKSKEWDTATTNYEKLSLSLRPRTGFTDKEMARIEEEIDKVMQIQAISVAKE